MAIGNVIIELRKERNLSQKKLAEAIGISQAAIAKIEINRNEATSETIRKLANFFEVSSDYLLELADDYGARFTTASTTAPPAVPKSSEESKLLEIYNSLSPDMKDTLWGLLKTWTPDESFIPTQKWRK